MITLLVVARRAAAHARLEAQVAGSREVRLIAGPPGMPLGEQVRTLRPDVVLVDPDGEPIDTALHGIRDARARVIVYNKATVNPADVQNYEDLANPKLKGKVCTRSGSHVYNLSLMSALIEQQIAERRQAHFVDLYKSGRWKHYYTDEQFVVRIREAIAAANRWAEIAPRPEDRLAAQ